MFSEGSKRTAQQTDLYDLGYQFGKLMYVLDAFEDYEKDYYLKQFNPLQLFFQQDRSLSKTSLEYIRKIILDIQETLFVLIQTLPIESFF